MVAVVQVRIRTFPSTAKTVNGPNNFIYEIESVTQIGDIREQDTKDNNWT
jgi:hypothetical protein